MPAVDVATNKKSGKKRKDSKGKGRENSEEGGDYYDEIIDSYS